MGRAVFPPCCLTWGQTLVEVMKIMVTSFKRSQAHTSTLSAPDLAAGHHRPTPPWETPGPSQASLGQSLLGSLLLSPGSWCTRFCVCLQESVSPVLCEFWQLHGGANGPLRGLMPCPGLLHPAPCPCGRPLLTHTSTGDTQTQFCLSLCGVPWCAQGFVWALWASLAGMGLDSKSNFTPPTDLLGLLLCPWTWSIFFCLDPTLSCWRLFSSKL